MHYQPGKYSLETQLVTINNGKITNTDIVTNLQFNHDVYVQNSVRVLVG